MQELLPLSLAKTRTETPVYRSLSLPLSGTAWVTFADLSDQYSLSAVKDDLELLFPQGYLIRGCGPEAVSTLESQGGVILKTGLVSENCSGRQGMVRDRSYLMFSGHILLTRAVALCFLHLPMSGLQLLLSPCVTMVSHIPN